MSFKDRYNQCKTWHEKVLVMGLYHLTQKQRWGSYWNMTDTAEYFEVSKGLVSENIRLYKFIDEDIRLTKYTREQALRNIK